MANTIIQLKNSGVPGNVPSTLQPGELAVNYTDGKLYYGNASNTAILFDAITEPSGLNGEIQFNSSGVFGASANLKYDTATKTLTVDEVVSQTTGRIFNHANGAFSAANSATTTAQAAYNTANSSFNTANSATITAQAGFNHANGAFSTANTKLNSSGGTISGDLIISGNLTITGNTVTHSANDFIVNDPIILLANNNPGNVLDIGFVAHYEDGSANTKHTGLILSLIHI